MSQTPAVGDLAPSFDLPSDGGGRARLADFRGRPLVLFIYPQDDTETCTAEAIAFNGLRRDFEKAGAALVGLSPDAPAAHDRFKKKYRLALTLASDESKATLQAYGAWGEKSLFGRRYMGVLRTTFLIDAAGRVARTWEKVRVRGHAEDVLAATALLRAAGQAAKYAK